jgi:hypothetical protein
MTMVNWEAVEAIATGFTVCGIFIAAYQLWQTERQNRTRFEDDLMHEYRDLIKTIPVKALLGQELTGDEFSEAYPALYHYVDLSNQQVFLRQKERITPETWEYWREGIRSNLSRPVFKKAWDQIKPTVPESFTELRRLEQSEFKDDPAKW